MAQTDALVEDDHTQLDDLSLYPPVSQSDVFPRARSRTRSSGKKTQGPAADAFPAPAKTGFLNKEGGTGFWQKRWMVLDHHYLFYYKAKDSKHPQNDVCLADYDRCTQVPDCKKSPYAFQVSSSQITNDGDTLRSYLMHADSEAEMHEWIAAIQREMNSSSNSATPDRSATTNKSLAPIKSPSPSDDKLADSSSRGSKNLKPGGILTRLRGGGTKKAKKETKPTVVQVDGEAMDVVSGEATQSPALVHLTADRSRGQQGRRPPTRGQRLVDAGVAPMDIFAGREVAVDKAEPLAKCPKPTPPVKAPKPGENSPATKPRVAMKPPNAASRDKGSSNTPLPKPAPRSPRTGKSDSATPKGGPAPALPTKPKPAPRRSRTETTKTTKPEGVSHTTEVLTKSDSAEVEQTHPTETNVADGVQDVLTGKDENQSPADVVKMETEEQDVETKSEPEEEKEMATVENNKSETLEVDKTEQESLTKPESKEETVGSSPNVESPSASANTDGESEKGGLAEQMGFEVVSVEEVEDSKEIASDHDMSKDQVISQGHNGLKDCAVSENPLESESSNQTPSREHSASLNETALDQVVSDDQASSTEQSSPENPDKVVTTEVATGSEGQGRKKSDVNDEIKSNRNSLSQKGERASTNVEPKKRNSHVFKRSPSVEVKTSAESKRSVTDSEPVTPEDQNQVKSEEKRVENTTQSKPLDSGQQVELAASKLRALSSSPVSSPPAAMSNGPDSVDMSVPDVVSILQSATDPKTALDKAKEILRQAHKASIDAERARREAVLERELAKQERAEAEMKKKNATEILKLARAALSSIKK